MEPILESRSTETGLWTIRGLPHAPPAGFAWSPIRGGPRSGRIAPQQLAQTYAF